MKRKPDEKNDGEIFIQGNGCFELAHSCRKERKRKGEREEFPILRGLKQCCWRQPGGSIGAERDI
jgi:hypothetical protein